MMLLGCMVTGGSWMSARAHTYACGGEAWGKQRPMGLHPTSHTHCRPGTMPHTSVIVVWVALCPNNQTKIRTQNNRVPELGCC